MWIAVYIKYILFRYDFVKKPQFKAPLNASNKLHTNFNLFYFILEELNCFWGQYIVYSQFASTSENTHSRLFYMILLVFYFSK